MKEKKFIIVLLISFFLPFHIFCSGGGGDNDTLVPLENPIEELTLNSTRDVPRFNGYHIYALITALPSNKPESNYSPSYDCDFSLQTTQYHKSMVATYPYDTENPWNKEYPYKNKQIECDINMREIENKLLSLQYKQLDNEAGFVTAAAPSPIQVGTIWQNIIILDGTTWDIKTTITATCRYISNHAYIFVDNRDDITSYLSDYGNAFNNAYNTLHNKFGSENDVDHNGKIIIIFSRELGDKLLGYFYSGDKYDDSVVPNSNEGDIIYITTDAKYQGNIIKGTLAHELQHMIYFDEHYNRGVTNTLAWLNEALSQAAEYLTGYTNNHNAWIKTFLYGKYDGGWPRLSLTHWTRKNNGYGAIFIRYIIDRFGDNVIHDMCPTDKIGIFAVESATGVDFNVLFKDFAIALVVSGTGDCDKPEYNFKTLNLQSIQPQARAGLVPYLYPNYYSAGETVDFYDWHPLYPYEIFFTAWNGNFGTMKLTGKNSIVGMGFGLIH